MLIIKVLPTKASAKKLKHPEGPVLGDGAFWPNDSFTARRLADRSIERASPDKTPATTNERTAPV